MRNKLWKWATAKHQEGMILPRWLLVIRAILSPLDTFYWLYGSRNGYNPQYDEWRIHGVRYTGAALRALAEAQGETYRITRTGECVTLERLDV
jgi:hypothetical protein